MTEEKLIDHIISRLEPQILDYVEVRHPQTTSYPLQIIDKYEERFLNRKIRGSSWEFRDTNPSENNRFPNRNRQENWRETRSNNGYSDNSRPRREFNTFENQGVADNRRFDGRRRDGQSDHGFHNQGGRQGGSRNSTFREGSRKERSGQYEKARETRTTTSGTNRAAERRPVRSKQATAVRPCPYYLRSRVKQPEGIPEERRSIGIESIPQNNIRRRSLSMEALDGDPVDRSE
ncbi:uncharacterized protein TNCV_4164011 [Trichonephila clavipes]|nr:uncharacterized protein TNCV_4164011 [Trichonephila clavipes]